MPVSVEYADCLQVHRRLIREAVERHGGYDIGAQGDCCLVAFERVSGAIAAAVDAQLALTSDTWPPGVEFRVRMDVTQSPQMCEESGRVLMGLDPLFQIF